MLTHVGAFYGPIISYGPFPDPGAAKATAETKAGTSIVWIPPDITYLGWMGQGSDGFWLVDHPIAVPDARNNGVERGLNARKLTPTARQSRPPRPQRTPRPPSRSPA